MKKKVNNFRLLSLLSGILVLGLLVAVFHFSKSQTPMEAQIERILEEESDLLLDPKLKAEFVSHLIATAKDHEFDPLLILAIMKVESSFKPHVISGAGAVGLLQIKPIAAHEVTKMKWIGFRLLKDPFVNVHLGVRYLSYLREVLGKDNVRMLSGYNLGPTAVKRSALHSTKYARKVLKIYAEFLKKMG